MKKYLFVLVILVLALRLPAQSNAPVRLALISEADDAAAASDMLTAHLSVNPKIHLLERNDIERVYREQGLSAANRNDLKLGRILGADGLLVLNITKTPQATNLTARLIAVKPGVILTDGKFPWPVKDMARWAESVAVDLNPLLPKLSLLPKDAVPISVVNLRSAVQSDEAKETERQLRLLAIQRLSQERQFFVLERQKMQLLGEEKELKSDDSAFWDGCYLLEGVLDQNGYSKDTITISARLTPSKGGAPLLLEAGGSRSNYSEAVNQLALKVAGLLKIQSTVKEWNAADEAAQYLDEAKWALRWGVFSEGQAAADTAWALGKRDLDTAVVRVRAYVMGASAAAGQFRHGGYFLSSGYDENNKPLGSPPTDAYVKQKVKNLAQHALGMVYEIHQDNGAKNIDCVSIDTPPDPKGIDCAMRALELYYEFSRASTNDHLKVASPELPETHWRNSDWYNLGVEVLSAAARVLQAFNMVADAQRPDADRLAELRALARSVAEWISQSPAVRDSYFVGDRAAVYDELGNTMVSQPNIFKCKVNWGCFWQERPEDCLALYRQLMSSPVFSYIHRDFWIRPLESPRLVAWNDDDRRRIPMLWTNFLHELDGSTNLLLRLEARALALADIADSEKIGVAFTNLFNAVFENRNALVANNVEVLYLEWRLPDLVIAKTGGTVAEPLQHLFYSEYYPKLQDMDREYRSKTVTALQFASVFERQMQYLKENKPYDFVEFVRLFGSRDYSRTQALLIQPLIVAYKSNLVSLSQNASAKEKGKLWAAITQVGFLENNVTHILNPPAVKSQPQIQAPKPAVVAQAAVAAPIATNMPEIVTNFLTVSQFLVMPLDSLGGDQVSNLKMTAHHWHDGKLLLDFEFDTPAYAFDGKGNGITWEVTSSGIATVDPATRHWEVMSCPKVDIEHRKTQNLFYNRSALFQGEVFTCDNGEIRKHGRGSQTWEILGISDGGNDELFVVNGHLYGANRNTVFEIVDGGKGTRLLASTRRHPPASALDTQGLGTPALFAGPDHSLRVSTDSKIFSWTGNDWREDGPMPLASFPPEISENGALFRCAGNGMNQLTTISCLATESNTGELCLSQELLPANFPNVRGPFQRRPNAAPSPKPLWENPPSQFFANMPAAMRQSDLFLMADRPEAQEGAILCFSRGLPSPRIIRLKFETPGGCPPTAAIHSGTRPQFPTMLPAWMLCAGKDLFCGVEYPDLYLRTEAGRIRPGFKPGVWVLPLGQIDAALAALKQAH